MTPCILDFILETLISERLRRATWKIRMGGAQARIDYLTLKISLCSVKTKISALNEDVNLVDCAYLKATLLAGGRGVRESPGVLTPSLPP